MLFQTHSTANELWPNIARAFQNSCCMCDAFSFDPEVKSFAKYNHVSSRKHRFSLLRDRNNHNPPSQGYSLTTALSVGAVEFLDPSASSYAPDLKWSSILAAESASTEHIVCNREFCEAFASQCRLKRVSSSFSVTPSK
jgi:hypothetical protein